jgi:hypothetical protein
MNKSIEYKILIKIKKAKRGTLFFTDNFLSFGNAKAVAKALERLVSTSKLYRVATGMYVRPEKDEVVQVVLPSAEEIVRAISKRDKARIMPTGSYALYRLGLTTQVPMNIVFYTDATARKIKIGKQTITFKRASAKNVSAIGETSKLAIQALRSIGKDNVTEDELKRIKELLKKEKPFHLEHDLKLAPAWIRNLLSLNISEKPNG